MQNIILQGITVEQLAEIVKAAVKDELAAQEKTLDLLPDYGPVLTMKDMQTIFQIKRPETVLDQATYGHLPAGSKVGRSWRWDKSAVVKFIQSQSA